MAFKKIFAVILVSLLSLPLPACSSSNKALNWGNWWGGKKEKEVDQKSVNDFFENIRPAVGNAESHYLLACHYQERNRHREAVEEFRKAIAINPKHLKAYNSLGVSFDHLKNYPLAIESYKRALSINPDLDYVQNNLGYSYLLSGSFDEAVKAFQKALALNPGIKRFHNNLGLAYAEKGQFNLALNEFKKAGEEASAHYNIGQFYFKKGLYKEARNHYAAALELNPSSQAFNSAFRAASALTMVFDSKPPEKAKASTAAVPAGSSPQAKDGDQGSRVSEVPEKIARNQEAPLNPDHRHDRDNKGNPVIIPPSLSVKDSIPQPRFSPYLLESKSEEANRAQTPEAAPPVTPSLQRIFSQSPSSPPILAPKDKEEFKAETINAPLKKVSSTGKEVSGGERIDNISATPTPLSQREISSSQPLLSHEEIKAKNEAPSDNLKKGAGSHPETSFKIAVGYELQLGAFRSRKQAKSQLNNLQAAGFSAILKPWKDKRGYEWHVIVLGPFESFQEALAQKKELAKSGKAQNSFIRVAAMKIDSPKMAGPAGKVPDEKGKLARVVGIEISNGNGIRRMAQMLGNCLSEHGLNVCRLTNASNFNHAETTIYYQKGYRQAAQHLADYFPGLDNLKELEKLDRAMVKVKILIGKDLLLRSKPQETDKAS